MEMLPSVDSEALSRMVEGNRGYLVIWLEELGNERYCGKGDCRGYCRSRRIDCFDCSFRSVRPVICRKSIGISFPQPACSVTPLADLMFAT
jgi:hypothetical protein